VKKKWILLLLGSLPLLLIATELVMEKMCPVTKTPADIYGYDTLQRCCYPAMTITEIQQLYKESYVWFRFRDYLNVGEAERSGKYCNVRAVGYRQSSNEKWPMTAGEFNVWFFGGSSMFGYGLPDWQTIPAMFKESYETKYPGRTVNVYNFGCAGYQSTAEHIWFEQLLKETRIYPTMVVFMDGLNDSLRQGTPMYGDRFQAVVTDKIVRVNWNLVDQLAIVRKWKGSNIDINNPRNSKNMKSIVMTNQIERVLALYLQNINMTEAICERNHITPVFVWQPVPMYDYDLTYHTFGKELAIGRYPMVTQIYEVMATTDRTQFGVKNWVDLSHIQKTVACPLYVDACHYNAGMSAYIAAHLVALLKVEEGQNR